MFLMDILNSIKEINKFRKEIDYEVKEHECFLIVFNSIKRINRLRKEINRLLCKEISIIYF